MKYIIGISCLIIIGVAGLSWQSLTYDPGDMEDIPGKASIAMDTGIDEKAMEEKDHMAAQKYIDGTPKDFVLLDESDPVSKNEIDLWEARIVDYATNNTSGNFTDTSVHKLALKTASLFRLLKDASDREKSGLEPYTGLSGFNTMTLVMTTEKEFKETFGVTFSDFFYSLDTGLIKKSLVD